MQVNNDLYTPKVYTEVITEMSQTEKNELINELNYLIQNNAAIVNVSCESGFKYLFNVLTGKNKTIHNQIFLDQKQINEVLCSVLMILNQELFELQKENFKTEVEVLYLKRVIALHNIYLIKITQDMENVGMAKIDYNPLIEEHNKLKQNFIIESPDITYLDQKGTENNLISKYRIINNDRINPYNDLLKKSFQTSNNSENAPKSEKRINNKSSSKPKSFLEKIFDMATGCYSPENLKSYKEKIDEMSNEIYESKYKSELKLLLNNPAIKESLKNTVIRESLDELDQFKRKK